jgi:hypothetical protein
MTGRSARATATVVMCILLGQSHLAHGVERGLDDGNTEATSLGRVSIRLAPEQPVTGQSVTITVSGEEPTSCVPSFSYVSVNQDTKTIGVFGDHGCPGICPQVVTPWSFSADVGALTGGHYQIRYLETRCSKTDLVASKELEVCCYEDQSPWRLIGDRGFGNPQNDWVRSFGYGLRVGTSNLKEEEGAEIWELAGFLTWNRLMAGGFGSNENKSIGAMTLGYGFQYAATLNPKFGSEVWRSEDGLNWEQVDSGGFGNKENSDVPAMTTTANYDPQFEADILAGTDNDLQGCEIWHSVDGETWNLMGGVGFGDASNTAIFSFQRWVRSEGVGQPFKTHVYVGTENELTGCEVWHRNADDNTPWVQVNQDGFGDENNLVAYTMTVWNYSLYVGTLNQVSGAQLWRTSDGILWEQVNIDGFGDANNIAITSLISLGGTLIAATMNPVTGCEVWKSPNGVSWIQFNNDGFGDANNTGAPRMRLFEEIGPLLVSTGNLEGAEVWSLEYPYIEAIFFDDFESGSCDSWSAQVGVDP